MAPWSMNTTRSAAARANSISWLTTTIVIPDSRSSRITFSTLPTSSGSSALVGSSKRRMRGSSASARAIATRCCWPPESSFGYALAFSASPTRASALIPISADSALDFPRTFCNASVTLPSAFICGYRLNCWNTMPIFWRTRLMSTPGRVMSVPSTTTEPRGGSSSRLQQRSRVDLPEPEGPMMKTSSPCATARSMPFNTSRVPKDLCSARTSRIAFICLGTLGRDRRRVVAFHARHTVARRDLVDPRVLLRLDAEPLLVQARDGAVELHALQHRIHLRAAFLVIQAEHHRPDQARLVDVGRLDRRVLLRRP